MKKALLLALMGLFTAVAPALAYPPVPAANVNFASERGVPFGLVLDGQPMTRGMARQVHMERLLPGQHWADFTVPAAYGGLLRFRSRVWLEPGLETTFVLVTRPGRPLYLQQVQAVALYGPRGGYYGNGYNNGGYYGGYNSPTPYGPNGGYDPNDPYSAAPTPNGGYGPNSGYGNNPAGPNGTYGNTPNGANGGYGTTPGGGPSGGYNPNASPNGPAYPNGNTPNGGNYPNAASSYRALTPQDANALVQAVQQRISEVSKLNAAKQGLSQRSLRADDLTRLLRTLNSEACRIDLAKFAYSHVSDPENFNRVYDAFETEDGVRAVEQEVNQ